MPDIKFRLLGENVDLKSKIEEVLRGMTQIGSGTGMAGFGGRVTALVANPLTAALGAVTAGIIALTAGVKALMNEARQIYELGIRSGVSPRQASAIQGAAEIVGGSPETIAVSMMRLRRAQAEAQAGGSMSDMAKALQSFGLTMDEITKSTSFELFVKFLDKLKDGRLSAEQTAAGLRIFRYNISDLQIMASRGLGEKIRKGVEEAPSDEALDLVAKADQEFREMQARRRQLLKQFGFNAFINIRRMFQGAAAASVSALAPEGSRGLVFAGALEKMRTTDVEAMKGKTSKEIEDAQRKADADAAAKAAARLQFIGDLKEREKYLEESAKGFEKITPDRFGKMGLFLTTGAEKLSNELVALNRQSLFELQHIKDVLEEIKNESASSGEATIY